MNFVRASRRLRKKKKWCTEGRAYRRVSALRAAWLHYARTRPLPRRFRRGAEQNSRGWDGLEFRRQIAVDLKADADFDQGRSRPSHCASPPLAFVRGIVDTPGRGRKARSREHAACRTRSSAAGWAVTHWAGGARPGSGRISPRNSDLTDDRAGPTAQLAPFVGRCGALSAPGGRSRDRHCRRCSSDRRVRSAVRPCRRAIAGAPSAWLRPSPRARG